MMFDAFGLCKLFVLYFVRVTGRKPDEEAPHTLPPSVGRHQCQRGAEATALAGPPR